MADGSGDWGKGLAHGLEVAVGVGLGYLIGHWLGRKFGTGPQPTLWWDFGGVIVGCAAGMYSLIKESVRSEKKK
jgi:F0F1-type ATP synthase assembly protein I